MRNPTLLDRLLIEADRALKTLIPGSLHSQRPSPGQSEHLRSSLLPAQQRLSAGLMRVNHSGEVCAQALYQGQALTARSDQVAQSMRLAALEEVDHLVWCEQRLQQLHSRPSWLAPLWYSASFCLGALAGRLGDAISLGFIEATEDQVGQHLACHNLRLPEQDLASRAIVHQMMLDEAAHAQQAIDQGACIFPAPIKRLMATVAKVMTGVAFYV